MKIIESKKCEVTIRRPDGTVETLVHPTVNWMNDHILKAMNKAMADAGRGVVLSYKNIDAVVEKEESDYFTRCERCAEQVDTRKAYGQKEWTRFGGKPVRVTAFYCDSCKRLLSSIGAGEHSDLEERRGEVPSYELEYKGDEDV